MKLIERSPFRPDGQSITLTDRLRGIWKFGLAWERDLHAQEELIGQLGSGLDNRYIMLRNISLPSLGLPVPLILVGPAGVKVIQASALRGIYRAKGEQWSVMVSSGKGYVSARPNLLRRSALMARAVQQALEQRGHHLPDIEPIVFFASPGLHVEKLQPEARLVQRDDIEHFLGDILQGPTIMDSTGAQVIADSILKMESMKAAPQGAGEPGPLARPVRRERKLVLKTWQWLVIGLLAAAALVALTLLAAIVLGAMNSP